MSRKKIAEVLMFFSVNQPESIARSANKESDLYSEHITFNGICHSTQLTFTCPKSTIKILEKGEKYVQS